MRIGILGGTFDPIHIGHMEMARVAVRELSRMGEPIDKLLIIPAGHPYFKGEPTPYDMRCEMVRLAVDVLNAENPMRTGELYELSRIESDEENPTYTYETLERLKGEYPGCEIYFICGGDVFTSIRYWRRPDLVLKQATLAAFGRSGSEYDKSSGSVPDDVIEQLKSIYEGARAVMLDAAIPDVSSTVIRERVRSGEKIGDLVAREVASYIYEHGLYQ